MSKGAYRASDVFTGSRCASRSSGALKSAQGKMSSAHGVASPSKNNNMNQGGKNTLGSKCPTFSSGPYAQPKVASATSHAKQPRGHKSVENK